MPRVSVLGNGQGMEGIPGGQRVRDLNPTFPIRTVGPSGADDKRGADGQAINPFVVGWPHRVRMRVKGARVC